MGSLSGKAIVIFGLLMIFSFFPAVADSNAGQKISNTELSGQSAYGDPENNNTGIALAFTNLTYLTHEVKPATYLEDGKAKGYAVDVLKAVLEKLGTNISDDKILVMEWPAAYEKTVNEPNNVLFLTLRIPERKNLFKWAGPVTTSEVVLYTRKDANISIPNPENLSQYRIGVINNSVSQWVLPEYGYPGNKFVFGSNPDEMLSLLDNNSIDIWSTSSSSEWFVNQTEGGKELYEIAYSGEPYGMYFAFSSDTPDSLVSGFQQVLNNIKEDKAEKGYSVFEKILYNYTEPVHMEPPMNRDDAIKLVRKTAEDLKTDLPGTIAAINNGTAPYLDADNKDRYVIVYARNGTIVAEADGIALVGANRRGKTDVAGTPYRDQIIDRSVANGSAWVDYIFLKPDVAKLYYKSMYGESVTGSDGEVYVVSSPVYS